MKKLLQKELRLAASPLSFFFILFGFLTMAPGYPILLGAFFITFGMFQTFLAGRENNDVLFTALLPVAKKDVVKAKFAFCICIEACGFLLIGLLTLLRMTALRDAALYRQNVMMNANPAFLGFVLVLFGCFHLVFVRGFFRTAYRLSRPMIAYIAVSTVLVAAGETIHHIPGCEGLNAFGFDCLPLQMTVLAAGLGLYLLMTGIALRASLRRFEKVDL